MRAKKLSLAVASTLLGSLLLLAAVVAARSDTAAPVSAAGMSIGRSHDPVVVPGSELPEFDGVPLDELVLLARDSGGTMPAHIEPARREINSRFQYIVARIQRALDARDTIRAVNPLDQKVQRVLVGTDRDGTQGVVAIFDRRRSAIALYGWVYRYFDHMRVSTR